MTDQALPSGIDAYLDRFETFAPSPRSVMIPERRGRALKLVTAFAVLAVVVAILAIPVVMGRFQSRHTPQPAATLPSRPLPHHNGPIVMGVGNRLVAIDPVTGHQAVILSAPAGDVVGIPAYSPNGDKLAYLRGRVVAATGVAAFDSIWILDTVSGRARQLTTCHGCGPYDYISWSPDGSRLAFSETDQRGSLQLDLIDADGTHRTQLTDFLAGQNATQPTWSPDGSRIAFDFFTVARAPSQGAYPVVSIDVIKADGTGLVVLFNAAPAELGQNGSPYLEPAWSPDGSRIAYLLDPLPPGPGVDFQLWLMDSDGSQPTRIFQYPSCCVNALGGPAWSPDGTRIAVVTAHTLWVMNIGGAALTSQGVISGDRPAWQPLP